MHCPVRAVLNSMNSAEIEDWARFEETNGPLTGRYDSELLAQLNERMDLLTELFIKVHSGENYRTRDIDNVSRPWIPPKKELSEEETKQLERDKKLAAVEALNKAMDKSKG